MLSDDHALLFSIFKWLICSWISHHIILGKLISKYFFVRKLQTNSYFYQDSYECLEKGLSFNYKKYLWLPLKKRLPECNLPDINELHIIQLQLHIVQSNCTVEYDVLKKFGVHRYSPQSTEMTDARGRLIRPLPVQVGLICIFKNLQQQSANSGCIFKMLWKSTDLSKLQNEWHKNITIKRWFVGLFVK